MRRNRKWLSPASVVISLLVIVAFRISLSSPASALTPLPPSHSPLSQAPSPKLPPPRLGEGRGGGWGLVRSEGSSNIAHVWANEGGDKVWRSELRATADPNTVLNSVWDGTGISRDWWAAVQEDTRQSEYHVTWQDHTYLPDVDAAYQAPNRAHNLRTYFTADGIRVIPRTESEPSWEWGLTLTGYGYTGHVQSVGVPVRTVAVDHRFEYHYQQSEIRNPKSEIVEWYVNDEHGLEQGFTLAAAPESQIPNLSLLKKAPAAVSGCGNRPEDGPQSRLFVLELTTPHAPRTTPHAPRSSYSVLRIHVDTSNAVYPITIDPWIQWAQQAKLSAGYGDSNDYFGTVAISGDTVVVGAPDDDVSQADHTEAHSGGLIVSASSGFLQDNGDYLMVGHNDATDTTGNDCPSGVSSRWQRVWYFSKTDAGSNGGTVDITFDFSEGGMDSTPSGAYTLLKRDGTTGTFSGIATSSTIDDDQVIFSDVDSTNLGSYFTLGEGSPTAVTLARFAARPAGKDLTGFQNLSGLGMLVALGALGVATASAAAELSPLIIHCFQIPFRRKRIMNSKQQKRTMNKAFCFFLIAALLAALVGSTMGVTYASDGAGNALDFDGTDDYVDIDAVQYDMAGQQGSFTFSAWVKAANTHIGSKGTILGVNDNDGAGSIKLCLFVGGNGDNKITIYETTYELTGPVIGDNTWHHVAYARNGATGTLYVDGVSQGTHSASEAFESDDLWSIGQEWDYDPWRVSDALDGQVDEVRIWKTALDQSTIQDWMYRELTTAHPNKANLVGYWQLNDGSGTTATDSSPGIRGSGSANNGTLQNMDAGDWVTSTAPIGDTTVGGQTDIAALWANNTTASSSGLIIANSTFLQDTGDDIVFGHNNGSSTTTDDCPSGVGPRWQRVWYLDKTDVVGTSGGNVNLTFDFGDAGFGESPSGDYTLLKRSDEISTFSGIATSSTISDDQVIFNNVDSTDLGSYFTLGEGTPTAVTLARFTARSPARDLTGFRNLSGLGALVALGAIGGGCCGRGGGHRRRWSSPTGGRTSGVVIERRICSPCARSGP